MIEFVHISISIAYGKDECSFSGRDAFFKDMLDALGLLQAPFDANERLLVLPPTVNNAAFASLHDWLNIHGDGTLASKGLVVKYRCHR
jgi:hypothetical protein